MKKLKVAQDVLVTSECWTYYKLAVAQTSPKFNEWLATHLQVFTYSYGDTVFGECGKMYPISYFLDILDIKEIDVFDVSQENIIDFIIEQIDNGFYPVIDLDFNVFYNIHDADEEMHEALVYGYDKDNKYFFMPIINNGTFKEETVPFDVFLSAYEGTLSYFNKKRHRKFNRRKFFYGITLLKCKDDYSNSNVYYDYIERLKWENSGFIYTRQLQDAEKQDCFEKYYTGVSRAEPIVNCFKQILKNRTKLTYSDARMYTMSCLKIYETQKIMCLLLEWFIKEMGVDNNLLTEALETYRSIRDKSYTNVLLMYKYRISLNPQILGKVCASFEAMPEEERAVLKILVEEATKIYTEKLYQGHQKTFIK